jgi:hypothetical protein
LNRDCSIIYLNKGSVIAGIIALSIVVFAAALVYLIFYEPQAGGASNLYSNNWSGYAAVSSTSFDSVSAAWKVPDVASSQEPRYSSIWVGIGGFVERGNRLIQAGTEQDVESNGHKDFYAWFEALPRPPVTVGQVSPGDTVSTQIYKVPGSLSVWHVKLTKESGGVVTTLVDDDVAIRTNSASRASAEFIVEAPTVVSGRATVQLLPLANFGSVTFANCSTSQGSLGSSATNLYRLAMTSDGTKQGKVLATTGALSSDSFTVTSAGG